MPAVGEGQIVAQIKDAARAAAAAGTAGPAITGLVDAALRACRRARAQTSISTEGIRAKEFLATKNGGH
jgi:glutamyl-tRNA reductase